MLIRHMLLHEYSGDSFVRVTPQWLTPPVDHSMAAQQAACFQSVPAVVDRRSIPPIPMILEGAEQAANVDVFDRDRLIRAVRFADTTATDVMTPITEVTMTSDQQSTTKAVSTARKHGYFRLPVYRDEPGHIVGVLSLNIRRIADGTVEAFPPARRIACDLGLPVYHGNRLGKGYH